jgi:hypothetical protein
VVTNRYAQSETTARIGRALDSDYLILGSYKTAGSSSQSRFAWMCVFKTRRRKFWLKLPKRAARTSSNWFPGWGRLRERRGSLTGRYRPGRVLASVPRDRDAARYALGIEKLPVRYTGRQEPAGASRPPNRTFLWRTLCCPEHRVDSAISKNGKRKPRKLSTWPTAYRRPISSWLKELLRKLVGPRKAASTYRPL